MEHAPLRPVPSRPPGPVEPETAVREVGSWLPELDSDAARALALVVLAERPRGEVAGSLGVSAAGLGALLAAARKELRQTVVTLGGSGWCERAEGLISDRLDGVLAGRDVRRLDVHLRNCSRCVEHERRLVQATDALVLGHGGRPAPEAPFPVPLVEAPEDDGVEGRAPGDARPPAEEAAPANDGIEEEPAAEQAAPMVAAVPATPMPPTEGQIAAAAEVLVAKRTRGQIAAAVVWNSMIAIAILLALVTIAVTIVGITGGSL
jgi:Putative zinc-finger